MATVVWRAVPDSKSLQGRAPLVVEVRGLFYMLIILRRREDIGRFTHPTLTFFPTFCVFLREFERVQCSFIEQHEPISACLGALFYHTQPDRPPYMRMTLREIHWVLAQCQGLEKPFEAA